MRHPVQVFICGFTARKVKRRRWTDGEVKQIRDFFKEEFQLGHQPTLHKCREAITAGLFKGRNYEQLKIKVYRMILDE